MTELNSILGSSFNKHIYSSQPEPEEPTAQTLSGFEGPEKLLEIWFGTKVSNDSSDGLLNVPRDVWEKMLDIVKCKVLSTVSNEFLHSYLLSESSMFVYPNRLILKTCGTTTLLHAIPRIMEISRTFCPNYSITNLFYSRKAFMFPEKQSYPHGKWGDEVAYMDSIMTKPDFVTAGYVIGKINGDHWCLFMASSTEEIDENPDEQEDDVTLEILMTKLNKVVMKQFWEDNAGVKDSGKSDIYKTAGINQIYPGAVVDDYIFSPCGYSLNALIGPYYFTIHVTPEDDYSYASFETSVPVTRYYHEHVASKTEGANFETFEDVINAVIQKFQPEKFSVTLFTRNNIAKKHGRAESGLLDGRIDGFSREDKIVHIFGKWDLVFCHFGAIKS
ncbi:spermidine resistance protein [Nowakowskiella sp. JEL0078]|nr:spermidine resistance protein [Nowakowskiella sp. JEL0078]